MSLVPLRWPDDGPGTAHGGLLLTMFFWAIMIPSLYLLLETWDVLTLSTLRYLLAIPIMLALLWWREGGLGAPAPHLLWRIALLGTIGIAGLATLFTLGLAHSDPVTAIVIQSASPVVSTFVARALYKIPLQRGIGVALMLAVAGALLTMSPKLRGGTVGFRGGELLLICGSCCWAWYSLACQSWLAGYSQVRITAYTMVPAGIVLCIALLLGGVAGLVPLLPALPGPGPVLLLLFMTLTSTCLGVLFWHFGVSRLGLPVASLYLNLTPVFAVLITMALGVMPSWEQVAGGLLVIAGVMQMRLRRSPPPAPRE